ncbi:hypothetical protein CT0861_10198 [Colletotrichum tofieldiae]|uniref:Uncharacterized protein n=1 Tax=Colletotrichum tofieldiae TaxID=708197 RepID=A0A166LWV9_9PEZI|nr:hypothetical protein CT0861_10198 [Colletotrichum tofieldiae]
MHPTALAKLAADGVKGAWMLSMMQAQRHGAAVSLEKGPSQASQEANAPTNVASRGVVVWMVGSCVARLSAAEEAAGKENQACQVERYRETESGFGRTITATQSYRLGGRGDQSQTSRSCGHLGFDERHKCLDGDAVWSQLNRVIQERVVQIHAQKPQVDAATQHDRIDVTATNTHPYPSISVGVVLGEDSGQAKVGITPPLPPARSTSAARPKLQGPVRTRASLGSHLIAQSVSLVLEDAMECPPRPHLAGNLISAILFRVWGAQLQAAHEATSH